jgi:hypothetical protein
LTKAATSSGEHYDHGKAESYGSKPHYSVLEYRIWAWLCYSCVPGPKTDVLRIVTKTEDSRCKTFRFHKGSQ